MHYGYMYIQCSAHNMYESSTSAPDENQEEQSCFITKEPRLGLMFRDQIIGKQQGEIYLNTYH